MEFYKLLNKIIIEDSQTELLKQMIGDDETENTDVSDETEETPEPNPEETDDSEDSAPHRV